MDVCYVTEEYISLCLKCSQTRVIAAQTLGSKAVTPKLMWLVAKDIGHMGYTWAVAKSDNEPTMKALAARVKEMRIQAIGG